MERLHIQRKGVITLGQLLYHATWQLLHFECILQCVQLPQLAAQAQHAEHEQHLHVWLQRCGVEVIVLEARDRVGGRVHTLTGQGFSASVDLGASIITGVAAVTDRGLRSDPSALIAK